MLKKSLFVFLIIIVHSLCANIVIDKLIKLDDGRYYIQFYVSENNRTVISHCQINGFDLGIENVFYKVIEPKDLKIEIKCTYKNMTFVKKIYLDNKEKTYNLTILNPEFVKYDDENKFDVYYPNKQCSIKIIKNNEIYDMEKTPYGFYTKTLYVRVGDKVKFLVICPNGKNYTFNYKHYRYNNISKYKVVVLNIPNNLKNGDYLLLMFYVLNKFGHKIYNLNNISYAIYDPKDRKLNCSLRSDFTYMYLECYLNETGKYKYKVCYTNLCVNGSFNVSQRINKTKYGFELVSPKLDQVYNVRKKQLLFRIFVLGNPNKVYESNTGIVFKNESKNIFVAHLPIKLGKNVFNIFVLYKNRTLNKTYTLYASDKVPNITIYVNDTYKLNKSDKVNIYVDVKYNNKTLDSGKVVGYIKCGDVISQDTAKFNYDLNRYVLSFYVYDSGTCNVQVEYLDKNYVTVEKSKSFKVEIDKNYNYSFQITNAVIVMILIVFTAIIIVLILKSVL